MSIDIKNFLNNQEKVYLFEDEPIKKKEEKNDFNYQKKVSENSNNLTQKEIKKEKLSSKNNRENLDKNIEEEEQIEEYKIENFNFVGNINYISMSDYIDFCENKESLSNDKLNKSDCENLLKIKKNNNHFVFSANI